MFPSINSVGATQRISNVVEWVRAPLGWTMILKFEPHGGYVVVHLEKALCGNHPYVVETQVKEMSSQQDR